MSEKIRANHLSRKAVLYVRQSSPHQVIRNEESRRLQYGMEERLRRLGWTEVQVIDEDQGRSASGTAERVGFERMVAEVCLGKVGAVAAREVSRFARNSRDWQHLVEVCRMVDTLLVDHEAVYDPRRGNDRLLLGLKGSLNEYELDVLRMRSVEARREKARRGELIIALPAGYIWTDDQKLVKDPDRRIQQAVLRVFEKFLEFSTVRQVMLWFIEEGLEVPVRCHGVSGWETVWKRPTYQTMLKILRNPIYAGTYAYGKTETSVEFHGGVPRKRIKRRPMEQWLSLIYDHHEGYVQAVEFERIQQMISDNYQGWKGATGGAAKRGPALLSGLVRCGQCGRKLMVTYTGRGHDVQRYICHRGNLNTAEPRCISFGGGPVDDAVSREVLRVVQPAAVEASLQAGEGAATEHDDVVDALRLDFEAARYAAERAWKQYDATDPENRLVADELERRWNDALQKVQHLEDRIEQKEAERLEIPTPQPAEFSELAADLDRLWSDPGADIRLKKRLLRALIEEVIVNVDNEHGETILVIHWKGGVHTEHRVRRRRRGQNSLHTPVEVVEAVRALTLICPDDLIAGILSRNGLRTGRGNRWTRERVASLRSKRGIAKYSPARQQAEGWMSLTQAAADVGVSTVALRRAVERGDVEAMHPLPDGPWIFERGHLDKASAREALEGIRRRRRGGATHNPTDVSLFDSTT